MLSCTIEFSSQHVRVFSFAGNAIGAEGAGVLAESLKYNTTLAELNIVCM